MATDSSYHWNHGANPLEKGSSATAPATGSVLQHDGTKYDNVPVATAGAALIAAYNTANKLLPEKVAEVTLTTAQILALNATAISVLAAPGAGFVNIIKRVTASKAAGTAYADIAAGDDIAFKYTNTSGATAATLEMTGFADSTAATLATTVGVAVLPVANAAIVAHMLTGEITTGNSDFKLRIVYETVPVPVF